MRALGNILWHFPFLGFIDAFIMYLIGLLLTLTVVAAPLGLGLMQLGQFYLAPFGREMVAASSFEGITRGTDKLWRTYSAIVMIIWLPFGAVLAGLMVIQICCLFFSIFGIPAAIALSKALGTVFNPVGKRWVSVEAAQQLRMRAANRELTPQVAVSSPSTEASADGPRLTEQPPSIPSKAKLVAAAIGIGAIATIAILGLLGRSTPKPQPSLPPTIVAAGPKPTPSLPAQMTSARLPVAPSPTHHQGFAMPVDTATLTVDGQRLPLAGLEPVNRPEATQAARGYLAQAGAVACDPAGAAWRCVVAGKGIDVAEVFALSGFATAAADAPKAILDAEAMAKQGHRGVWGLSER